MVATHWMAENFAGLPRPELISHHQACCEARARAETVETRGVCHKWEIIGLKRVEAGGWACRGSKGMALAMRPGMYLTYTGGQPQNSH